VITESAPPFNRKFLAQLKALIDLHHTLYPRIPPQGTYFDSLVEQALKRCGWPLEQITVNTATTPTHDLLLGETRLLLRTETGLGTHPEFITIPKLCATETGAWDPPALIQQVVNHLARYEHLLMLRATWGPSVFHYQLVEIPLEALKRLAAVTVTPVGKRVGRPSLAGDVFDEADRLFRVHFDGADGKCHIQRLRVSRCRLLLDWDYVCP
jgi:hypothetical protein